MIKQAQLEQFNIEYDTCVLFAKGIFQLFGHIEYVRIYLYSVGNRLLPTDPFDLIMNHVF